VRFADTTPHLRDPHASRLTVSGRGVALVAIFEVVFLVVIAAVGPLWFSRTNLYSRWDGGRSGGPTWLYMLCVLDP
jgi:hypothetical protein